MHDDPADPEAGLIDLSGLSLRDLDESDNSSLLLELHRVLRPDPSRPDPIGGWSNSV
jgi:FXSXX-COOH protein